MKKITNIITNLVLISIFAAIGCVTIMAQGLDTAVEDLAEETRPFDFSDKYYDANGVQPQLVTDRASGQDGKSIFTKNADENYSDVRLLATYPAYNFDGSALYFNHYGELFDTSFSADANGREAMEIAKGFPMFVFPSAAVKGSIRQSNVLDARAGYFTKNPLGLSILVEVRFTDRVEKEDGAQILKDLGARNGYSLDGTPIIKTVEEIDYLTGLELITQKVRGLDTKNVPSFAIVKAIDTTKTGAVAPDAFLVALTNDSGEVLDAEAHFVDQFDCLRKSGSCGGAAEFQP